MKVEVLISCMHRNTVEEVLELVRRTNVQGPCVVISQCNHEEIVQHDNIKIIFTKERGLSRSRNMAIKNSTGDICLICDDDEILNNDYQKIISRAYSNNPAETIICFRISRPSRPNPPKEFRLNLKSFWQVSSIEISFKRQDIINNHMSFDERIGSGATNAGGEENKFLYQCVRRGLKGFYSSNIIGELIPNSDSQWFKGYNKKYFMDRAMTDRIILGPIMGRFLSLYFIIKHRKLIKQYNPESNLWHMSWILLR